IPLPGEPFVLPDWFFAALLFNPAEAFSSFSALAFNITGAFGFTILLPDFVSLATTTLSMVLWALVPLGLAFWRFRGQDL
ncbi:MAG: hypothetical protein V3W28_04520, partial [Thermoplasmata archaeon]